MLLFFKIFVWSIFAALVSYVILSWRYQEQIRSKIEVIRKTWYLLFVLGAIIYWSMYLTIFLLIGIINLIIALVFVLIDMFVFLSMYFTKIGDNELSFASRRLKSDELITDNREKLKNMFQLLKKEGIPKYYQTDSEYLAYLGILLQAYVEKDGMNVQILHLGQNRRSNWR